jgi:hypothetical membrane protein
VIDPQEQTMTDTKSRTTAHQPLRPSPIPQRRTTGAVLVASGVIYLAAEFIAAAAWSDPPYSYTHHFISDLGVHGPSTGFGQYMYSPLAWVMNIGFILFGITAVTGVAMLRGLPGGRRWAAIVLAALLAVGVTLVGLFPGSGEALEDGTATYHGLGAFAAFVSGNVLLIVLGRSSRSFGVSPGRGRVLVVLGALGFVSLVAFMAVLSSEGGVLIGLVERGVVYPIVIGLVVVGAAVWKRRIPTVDGGPVQSS